MVRWCWVNFKCRGVLLIWIKVGQGPTALAVGVGGCCLDIFSLVYHFSFLSPSLWETARYRLKYCPKGPLSPNQPTNQPTEAQIKGSSKVLVSCFFDTLQCQSLLEFYALSLCFWACLYICLSVCLYLLTLCCMYTCHCLNC